MGCSNQAGRMLQVLTLDADSLPLMAPDGLFNTVEYQQNGNLFWPDYWDTYPMNPSPAYRLLNLTSPWTAQPTLLTTESGQFLIDRWGDCHMLWHSDAVL